MWKSTAGILILFLQSIPPAQDISELLISRECLMGRPFPGRLPEGLALYNGVPGGKEPYKDAHCSACRQPGPFAEPQDPNVLYPHCPHDLGVRPPHLVGRGFSGSEGLSFSSCCQTEWGCSPEIPPGKARRAGPTCHPGQGPLGKTGEKAPGCPSSLYLVVCEEIWFLGWGRGMQDVRGKLGTPRCAKRVLGLCLGCTRGGGRARAPRKAAGP